MLQLPLQVVLGKDVPADARAEIEKAAQDLERFFPRITSCRVSVTMPDRRHRSGGLYDVHMTVRIPGHGDINVTRRAEDATPNEHVDVAIRHAFQLTRRQLQDVARKVRLDVKAHGPPDHGEVVRYFATEGYGFIGTNDGREVYFHRNSVIDEKFPQLKVGDAVRFVEVEGEKGPQASTVAPLGKHHLD